METSKVEELNSKGIYFRIPENWRDLVRNISVPVGVIKLRIDSSTESMCLEYIQKLFEKGVLFENFYYNTDLERDLKEYMIANEKDMKIAHLECEISILKMKLKKYESE